MIAAAPCASGDTTDPGAHRESACDRGYTFCPPESTNDRRFHRQGRSDMGTAAPARGGPRTDPSLRGVTDRHSDPASVRASSASSILGTFDAAESIEAKLLKMLMPALLDTLSDAARASPRHRSHHNLHPSLEASIQRLAIAMEPDTYVRPHRHPQTWELLIPLRGRFLFTAFDEHGTVRSRHLLGGAEGLAAFEFEAATWHTVTALEPGSVIFEVKEGPYVPVPASDLAAWSPPEGTAQAAQFVAEQRTAAGALSGASSRTA